MSVSLDGLKAKLQQYYNEERNKGRNEVMAKYNAVNSTLLYILGLVEHYSDWGDLEAIRSITKQFQQLERYAYDLKSTEYMEHLYQQQSPMQMN